MGGPLKLYKVTNAPWTGHQAQRPLALLDFQLGKQSLGFGCLRFLFAPLLFQAPLGLRHARLTASVTFWLRFFCSRQRWAAFQKSGHGIRGNPTPLTQGIASNFSIILNLSGVSGYYFSREILVPPVYGSYHYRLPARGSFPGLTT